VTAQRPGYDEVVLTTPDAPGLCYSRGCADHGTLATLIVTYGVLSDPGASMHSRDSLWPTSWGTSVPMCAACWDLTRQVVVKYRPGLVVTDITRDSPAPVAGQTSGSRA
jgi:hypothetical protein